MKTLLASAAILSLLAAGSAVAGSKMSGDHRDDHPHMQMSDSEHDTRDTPAKVADMTNMTMMTTAPNACRVAMTTTTGSMPIAARAASTAWTRTATA